MSDILTTLSDSILTITIDNQSKRNALTESMAKKLTGILKNADHHDDVRCVIITGAGDKAFCSGHDLSDMQSDDGKDEEGTEAPFNLPRMMTTPTIAVLNGPARAGGFVLAQSCDLRICDPQADLAANAAQLGMFPLGGEIVRLLELIPIAVAFEMLTTGRKVAAEEALHVGLVNKISSPGEALNDGMAVAHAIVGSSSAVVRAVKQAMAMFASHGGPEAAAFARKEGKRLMHGPDAREGIAAFLEKRRPRFA